MTLEPLGTSRSPPQLIPADQSSELPYLLTTQLGGHLKPQPRGYSGTELGGDTGC